MRSEQIILGAGCTYSTDCTETQLNNNVIVVGGSGSGKTMSIIEPRLLETVHSSLIVTVSKRYLVKKYMSLFRKRGYKVWDLNLSFPEQSNVSYDPLQYIKSYADISFLAAGIVNAEPKKQKNVTADPYWDQGAQSLLAAEIAYTLMTEDNPSFLDVLTLHERLEIAENGGRIQTSLDSKFEFIERKSPNSFAVRCCKSFHQLPLKTALCIFSSLNVSIDTLFTPELKACMGKRRRINFAQLATERTALFISTSAVNPTLHSFANLLYSQSIKELFEFAESRTDGHLPIPVQLLCDDFACGSTILNFPEYISIFREKQMSAIILLQSESQLERMYTYEDATTIINNCDTYVYMGGMDLQTSKNVSNRLNCPLEDVLYMPIGTVAVFRRGQKPIVTKRYPVQEHPLYQQVSESDIKKTQLFTR